MRVQKRAAMELLRTTWDRAGLELMRIKAHEAKPLGEALSLCWW